MDWRHIASFSGTSAKGTRWLTTASIRRHLSVAVRLRAEAIQTLFGDEAPEPGRKSGFTLPLEIAPCRKKEMEQLGLNESRFAAKLREIVSTTSRQPRDHEVKKQLHIKQKANQRPNG